MHSCRRERHASCRHHRHRPPALELATTMTSTPPKPPAICQRFVGAGVSSNRRLAIAVWPSSVVTKHSSSGSAAALLNMLQIYRRIIAMRSLSHITCALTVHCRRHCRLHCRQCASARGAARNRRGVTHRRRGPDSYGSLNSKCGWRCTEHRDARTVLS